MSDCDICRRPSKTFSARPLTFVPDEKLAYVERVCEILIEDRFGPGSYYESLSESYIPPELEPVVIFDLTRKMILAPVENVPVTRKPSCDPTISCIAPDGLHRSIRTVTTFARPPNVLSTGGQAPLLARGKYPTRRSSAFRGRWQGRVLAAPVLRRFKSEPGAVATGSGTMNSAFGTQSSEFHL